ncbi:MAG: cyclic nucleotide-binding domain-containing protein [Spirochaetales bacterium]|nr:cyclic nucleotide-binding domain-containing protein [Spirochaetales bacterium]
MEKFDRSKTVKNQQVSKGTILLLQGESLRSINFLHKGMAELLASSGPVDGMSPDEIIEKSHRVGLIKGDSVFGLMRFGSDNPYDKSVRALSDCVVSIVPASDMDLFNNLKGKINLNLKVLAALIQRIDSGQFLYESYRDLCASLNSAADSIALALESTNPVKNVPPQERAKAKLEDYSKYLKSLCLEKNVAVPAAWDKNLFIGTVQKQLGLIQNNEAVDFEELIDFKQFLFFKRLLRLPSDVLKPLFQRDEPNTQYIYRFLYQALEPILAANEKYANSIFGMVEQLFSDNGWVKDIITGENGKNKRAVEFHHYLSKFCWKIRKEVHQLIGVDLKKRFTVYSNLEAYLRMDPEQMDKVVAADMQAKALNIPQPTEEIQVDPGIVAKFKNLFKRILDFAEMPGPFGKEFQQLLGQFKKIDSKFENVPKLNSLKRRIAEKYFQLYEKCFIKMIDTNPKNFIPGIMLHFGALDESLIQPKHMELLDKSFTKNLYVDSSVPVMTLPYFLDKIHRGEVNPSLTDMGESFRDVLKRQEREKHSKKNKEEFFEDRPEDRVKFEIRKMVSSAYRMVFGSIHTAFPILCSEALMGRPEELFLDPQEVADIVNFLKQRDFSMFFRENVVHLKYGTDIILKEVVPNFILFPVYGTKMIMWQELDGPKRDSVGRCFLPTFFSGDKQKALLSAVGHFIWELHRVIAGANWMSPVDGGITGAYYDYITFYKKNPNLTPAVKDRLKEFVRKHRSDRDRFTSDYMNWVLNEYEGIPKLNNVAREIFYKFRPFPKAERERLCQRPVFGNLEMKYMNITRRNLLKIEGRIRKYEKSSEEVPKELSDYYDFLQK